MSKHTRVATPYDKIDHRMAKNIQGLHTFNSFVMGNLVECEGRACRARLKALGEMAERNHNTDLIALLEVFKSRWSHWFNGNRNIIDTDPNKVLSECVKVVMRLSYDEGQGVSSNLTKLAGFGLARVRTRGRKTMAARPYNGCEYHPENRAVSKGRCQTCLARIKRLHAMELGWIEGQEELLDRVLALPPSGGRGSFISRVNGLVEDWKRKRRN